MILIFIWKLSFLGYTKNVLLKIDGTVAQKSYDFYLAAHCFILCYWWILLIKTFWYWNINVHQTCPTRLIICLKSNLNRILHVISLLWNLLLSVRGYVLSFSLVTLSFLKTNSVLSDMSQFCPFWRYFIFRIK